jgi:glutamate-1-semialdehyde 2,1-aminomutase
MTQPGSDVQVGWAEREEITRRNYALLDRDLREKRLVFESRPYEAHAQFSNFCNMSCIMCWDGDNPPLKKMSPVVLERLRSEIAPHLSVITPHDGSEPTVVTWEETVSLVKDYSVQLSLTTNGQVFDEEKFDDVKDHLEMIVFSIDSHLPELFEKIRPGANAEKVYANLETAARLCEEHRIELVGQVVFMTLNGPLMPDMVAWMADRGVQVVNVTQMIDVNRHSWHLDATMHYSAEYLDWIKKQCVAVAEDRKIRLGWYLSDHEWFDFSDPQRTVPQRTSKMENDIRDTRMRFRHPGYCKYAYDRLRLRADGYISPCGLDCDGELAWGNLAEQHFEELWNGPTVQDLRRAHYSWDYPSICKSCRYVDLPPAKESRDVLDHHLGLVGRRREEVEPTLAIEAPVHMLRAEAPPSIVVRQPDWEIASYQLVTSPGGFVEDMLTAKLKPLGLREGLIELGIPDETWAGLETNIGYWWAVVAYGIKGEVARTPEVRCMIRNEVMPRIEGSNLKYPDEGHFATVYLGGERQVGWQEPGELPDRPPLRLGAATSGPGKRFAKRRVLPAMGTSMSGMSRAAYGEMVGHIKEVVAAVIPDGAVALVATKGDPELLEVEGRHLRHFPADADGVYLGHHPPDDDWAIERLTQARAAGCEFLVIPASLRWWLDHYPGFAEHLTGEGEPMVDDRQRCTIFDLRRSPPTNAFPRGGDELIALADEKLGYGGHHRVAFRRFYGEGDDPYPRFASDAAGYELIDSEGRKFIDWVNGGGPVILGYRHPAVTEAIATQLPVGPTLTLAHAIEVEVAATLTEMVPCAEMVAFGKNGSDAVTAAVRLARAVTGRETILQYGGHGFHDWCLALHGVPGVPKALELLVHSFPYNDLDALGALLEEHAGEVAAVVMEPVNVELPQPGYLDGVRELAHRHGALLVFDEVITALRLGTGGAQQRFGTVPDLACLGKAMANGMPLSAVVGKREYMKRLPQIAYGMTYRGETLSLAAARAVLRTVRETPVAEHLGYIGGLVRSSFDRACTATGVNAALLGPEARMTFAFGDEATVSYERREAAFVLECARRGILTNGNILPSLPHDEDAVARTEEAFGPALEQVKTLTDAAAGAIGRAVRTGFERCGTRSADHPGAAAGFFDYARDDGRQLVLRGWLLAGDEPCTIEAIGPRGAVRTGNRFERPDVAAAFPAVAGALHAGFALVLPWEDFSGRDRYAFTVRARHGDHTLFLCPVERAPEGGLRGAAPPGLTDAGTLRI